MAGETLLTAIEAMHTEADRIREGGGPKGIERQHRHGRLTARERISRLVDPGARTFECGLFAAHGMYRSTAGPRRPGS